MSVNHLLRLQKRILDSIEDDLAIYNHRKTKELQTYEREYSRDFKKEFRISSKDELLKRIRKSQITFCGDFHSFRQSQKTAIRLLRDAVRQDNNYILCLECIHQEYQGALDLFYEKKITLEELRTKINYDEMWPFPWENYKELLLFSLENSIQIVALNSGVKSEKEDLTERDIASAQIITDTAIKFPGHRLFVFYGDLHVARRHLPKATREIMRSNGKSFKATIIFQNEPQIFWKLARLGETQDTDVVKLRADTWCVMNSTPWVRLQSYVDWLEGNIQEIQEDGDLSTDYDQNISGKINFFSRHIQDFLKLENIQDIDVSIYTFENLGQLEKISKKNAIDPLCAKAIRSAIFLSRVIYIPQEKIIYVPSDSINTLVEASTLVLRDHLVVGENPIYNPKTQMGQLILSAARTYFGSKIINPKRKCDEVDDIAIFLQQCRGKKRNHFRFKRNVYHWAQKELIWLFTRKLHFFTPKSKKFSLSAGYEAARIVGFILGERLYYTFHESKLDLDIARQIFCRTFSNDRSARKFLLMLSELTKKSTYSTRSKLEKL